MVIVRSTQGAVYNEMSCCVQFLVHNFHVDSSKVFGIPEDKLCEVGMQYHL